MLELVSKDIFGFCYFSLSLVFILNHYYLSLIISYHVCMFLFKLHMTVMCNKSLYFRARAEIDLLLRNVFNS